WLPVLVTKSQEDKAYWMPDVGEQVICLMDERDEAGVVLGAIYSSVDQPPVTDENKYHITFKDGTSFEYDRSQHVLELSFRDDAVHEYDPAAHFLSISFGDATEISDDAEAHRFAIEGAANASVSVDAPGGIALVSGSASVRIESGGVSISPPLPTSSTV